jgi:hypothetical protein
VATGADGAKQAELQIDLSDRLAAHRLADLGGSVGLVAGRLYNEVQIKHPRNARFSLQNERGLFFVKVYQAALVGQARGFEPGAELVVLGELHSFVNRRCKNHHVFIKAQKIFPLTETPVDLMVNIEKE